MGISRRADCGISSRIRPLSDRNGIELQAITALNHVGDVVLLLIDPSEHCGYPLTTQTNTLHEIEKTLTIQFIVAANKCDLADFHGEWEYLSAEIGDGMDAVMRRVVVVIDSQTSRVGSASGTRPEVTKTP
ncbi:MAG: hypothetical protein U9N46_09170 [Euryarchaeota archaeon]|nr:hypothetical protein [Euryarchaeota archaeon]